jgi:biopolymer transport protein ExbB
MNWLGAVVDYGVMGTLVVLSILSVGIALERTFAYRSVRVADYADRRELEIFITSKLHLIATIGANSPYIGLLGTVLGIMLTFHTMGERGFMDTGKIMVGLSLALKATAMGLFVAIPSIVFYNLLLRRVKVLLMQWDVHHGRK